MKKIIFTFLIWTAAGLPNSMQAQILTVYPGTDMTIKSGTIFSADSLVLTPSADFTMSNLGLNKYPNVVHPITNPYIARVYQLCPASNPFSGSVQINYRDGAELNGLPENGLLLNIFNGTNWQSYPAAYRDAGTNYALTTDLKGVSLRELTLADDCPAPTIQCNENLVVNAKQGRCGTVVKYQPPVVTSRCGPATVKQIAGLASSDIFPVGCTINTFVATNTSGKTDTCNFTVTVLDKEPPHISHVYANPSSLWPPNHAMKNVTIHYNAWDNCGPVISTLSVSSNEPVYGTGSYDKAPDWVIIDNHHLQLRAERSGQRNERVYTITIRSTDNAGNATSQKTRVVVPRNNYDGHSYGWYDDDEDDHGNNSGHSIKCKVIPNPSSTYFDIQIESTSSEKVEAKLFDLNGRLISNLKTVKNQTIRFGEKLRPGVYMVEIVQGKQRKMIRIVKQ